MFYELAPAFLVSGQRDQLRSVFSFRQRPAATGDFFQGYTLLP
jgi:hypothetical protein